MGDTGHYRAALVLWLRAERDPILARGGPAVSVPFRGDLVRDWEASGAASGDGAFRDALALATAVRKDWPKAPWARCQASERVRAGAWLDALGQLDDVEQRIAFLVEHTLTGAYVPADNPGLAAVLMRLPPHRAGRCSPHSSPTTGPFRRTVAPACSSSARSRRRLPPRSCGPRQ